MDISKPLLLIVLDGWGFSENPLHNAILQAQTPVWDDLWKSETHTLLSASGEDVGLPAGQMGNSEVGHMTMGAGRVIYQDFTRINKSIQTGEFFTNQVLLETIQKAKQNKGALHILGLLSPGGIHSHEDHIGALIKMAQNQQLEKIYLHAFLDGRDTPPQSAAASLKKFAPFIVSIMGRFYAMDRDKRLERTNAAIDLLLHGHAEFHAADPLDALKSAYDRHETDEFVKPTQIKPVSIEANDTIICMNFRTDRARQLCHGLIQADPQIKDRLITLTRYDSELPVQVAFPPINTLQTLSEVLAEHQLTQLRVAETEKYAHVTFFFNAGIEEPVSGESRILIPSPEVATYDLKPEMSALEITEVITDNIMHKTFDVIICNYANADMVGHTGKNDATIIAIETIDKCLGKIITAIKQYGGSALITADHGNAELMWDSNSQQPHTAHTTNLVPLVYVGDHKIKFKNDKTYGLQDIAPTMLELLKISKPKEMTGVSLIRQS